MMAAAKNPDLISRMVVWGSNAFVSQQDLELYEGTRSLPLIVFNCQCSPILCELCILCILMCGWVSVGNTQRSVTSPGGVRG